MAAWSLVIASIVLLERAALGARLAEILIVLVGLAVTAWAARGGLRNTLVICCSLVFGLAVLEGVLLAIGTRTGAQAKLKDDSLGGERAVVGWGPTKVGTFRWAKIAPDGKVIYDTRVTVDAHLNRKTVPSDGPGAIAFFGDSWIFGDGVNDDGTLPQAFADLEHRRIPVLNLSYNGWSPAANLAALDAGLYGDLLHEPRHFILFTATFHIERTACKGDYATSRAPRYVLDGKGVTPTGTCAWANGGLLAPVIRFLQKFELYNRFAPKLAAPGKRDVDTYVKIIEAFVDAAKRKYDVRTTVLFAPFRDEYIKGSGYTEADILATLRKAGVDVLVDELPPTDNDDLYWIPGDKHPTAAANSERARAIEAHLKQVDPKALEIGDGASHMSRNRDATHPSTTQR